MAVHTVTNHHLGLGRTHYAMCASGVMRPHAAHLGFRHLALEGQVDDDALCSLRIADNILLAMCTSIVLVCKKKKKKKSC